MYTPGQSDDLNGQHEWVIIITTAVLTLHMVFYPHSSVVEPLPHRVLNLFGQLGVPKPIQQGNASRRYFIMDCSVNPPAVQVKEMIGNESTALEHACPLAAVTLSHLP